jgi:hypothetical protein
MKPARFDPTRYLVAPDVELDGAAIEAFERIWETIDVHSAANAIQYACPFHMFEFLTYLVQRKGVLLHGSDDPEIARFEPRQQTDFRGQVRESVFATDDGIWPIYFAIVDRERVKVLKNACFEATDEGGIPRTHYLFAVPAKQLKRRPWREGAVYVLPRETFVQDQVIDAEGRVWKEWASDEPVYPLARLMVGPGDFPFLDDVQGFRLTDILRPVLVVVLRQLGHSVRSWFSGRGHRQKNESRVQ